MELNKSRTAFFVIGIVLLLGAASYFTIHKSQEAKLSEGAAYLTTLQMTENNYKKSFGAYPDTKAQLNDLGFRVEHNPKIEIYFDTESVPPKIKQKLSESWLPILSKDTFRILLVMSIDASNVRIGQIGPLDKPSFQDLQIE